MITDPIIFVAPAKVQAKMIIKILMKNLAKFNIAKLAVSVRFERKFQNLPIELRGLTVSSAKPTVIRRAHILRPIGVFSLLSTFPTLRDPYSGLLGKQFITLEYKDARRVEESRSS